MTPEEVALFDTDLVNRVVVEITWHGIPTGRVSVSDAENFTTKDWSLYLDVFKLCCQRKQLGYKLKRYDPLLKTLTLTFRKV